MSSSTICLKVDQQEVDGLDLLQTQIIEKLDELQKGIPEKKHFVLVQFQVNRLAKLNTSEETAFVDFWIQLWWKDKELIGKSGDDFDIEKIWRPSLEIVDAEDVEEVTEGTYWINDQFVEHGIITFYQRYKATVATPLNLRSFPFDQQFIKISISDSGWAMSDLEFYNITPQDLIDDIPHALSLTEWEPLSSIAIRSKGELSLMDKRLYPNITLEIPIKRKSGFYLNRIVPLIFIIGLMVCGVPIVDSENLHDRFQITLTLLLSQIAFHFVVADTLPKVPYATKLDHYFVANYIFISISAVENILAYLVGKHHSKAVAQNIDYASVALFGTALTFATIRLIVFRS